jgi:hypothetical protein
MVKADAAEPKTWMEFVKEVRDKNPGMALKDILRLASKLRGKSSSGKSSSGKSSSGNSGKKQKKRGGMLLPMLGGEGGEAAAVAVAPKVVAPEVVAGPAPAAVAAKLNTIPEGDENQDGGRKSKKRSKKSKKSRKSKKTRKTKRRH